MLLQGVFNVIKTWYFLNTGVFNVSLLTDCELIYLVPKKIREWELEYLYIPLELTDAHLGAVLPAGGEPERPISIPRPPSGCFYE